MSQSEKNKKPPLNSFISENSLKILNSSSQSVGTKQTDVKHHKKSQSFTDSAVSNSSSGSSSGKSWIKHLITGTTQKHSSSSKKKLQSQTDDINLKHISSKLLVLTTSGFVTSSNSEMLSIESVREFLDETHGENYFIYSLSGLSSKESFNDRTVQMNLFNNGELTSFVDLWNFCFRLTSDLVNPSIDLIVVHGNNNQNDLAFAICSVIACQNIFRQVDQIIKFYEFRCCSQTKFKGSQKKYIKYLSNLSFSLIDPPHFQTVDLISISFAPIPLFNRHKTSCRPFILIFNQDKKQIFSNYQHPNKLRTYSSTDTFCKFPVNISFNGDLIIQLYHAPVGRSRSIENGGIKICQFIINSNFSTEKNRIFNLNLDDLDDLDLNYAYSPIFCFEIETNSSTVSSILSNSKIDRINQCLPINHSLFKDQDEFQQILREFEQDETFKTGNLEHSTPSTLTAQDPDKTLFESIMLRPRTVSSASSSSLKLSKTNSQSCSSFVNPLQVFKTKTSINEEINPHDTTQISTSTSSMVDTQSSKIENDQQSNDDQNIRRLSSSPSIAHHDQLRNSDAETTVMLPIISITESNYDQLTSTSTVRPPEHSKLDADFVGLYEDGQYSNTQITNTICENLSLLIATPEDKNPIEKSNNRNELADKVRRWAEGKQKNIRALLSSLSNIVWSECQWKGMEMYELITVDQVRKAYRKAVLYIHPDKVLHGDTNEELARLIFLELNEAWSQFLNENHS